MAAKVNGHVLDGCVVTHLGRRPLGVLIAPSAGQPCGEQRSCDCRRCRSERAMQRIYVVKIEAVGEGEEGRRGVIFLDDGDGRRCPTKVCVRTSDANQLHPSVFGVLKYM